MKKRRKLFILLLSLIGIVLLILVVYKLGSNVKENEVNDTAICDKIVESKNNKEDFLIIIYNEYKENSDFNEAISDFYQKYKNLNKIEIKVSDLKKNCMRNVFSETGMYEELYSGEAHTIVSYKAGAYVGVIANPLNVEAIENYLDDSNIIEKEVLNEIGLSYDNYKKNINLDDYMLVAISDESFRNEKSDMVKKVFPDYKFDVFNIKSNEGGRIFVDLNNNYDYDKTFSHIFYFKNGKLISDNNFTTEDSLNVFKNSLEKAK